MNPYPRQNIRDRFFHIILHIMCIIRISYKLLIGKILYEDFKNRLKFFRDGIIRSVLRK